MTNIIISLSQLDDLVDSIINSERINFLVSRRQFPNYCSSGTISYLQFQSMLLVFYKEYFYRWATEGLPLSWAEISINNLFWNLFLRFCLQAYFIKTTVIGFIAKKFCKIQICSKIAIKTPERRHRCHWRRSGVFLVNVKQVSRIALVLTKNK